MDSSSVARRVYRACVPLSIRTLSPVVRVRTWLLGGVPEHDDVYSADYYDRHVEKPAVRSAGVIAGSIIGAFGVSSVVDVGCGTGALLEAFRDRGCQVFGLEYSEAALRYCRARGLDVVRHNLEREEYMDNRCFGAAMSMEVAEHLTAKAADRYVGLLCRLSGLVVLTAAPPGQGGPGHVNEQPPSYWISKFERRGYRHDDCKSLRLKRDWQADGSVCEWYWKNLMVFRRRSADDSGFDCGR